MSKTYAERLFAASTVQHCPRGGEPPWRTVDLDDAMPIAEAADKITAERDALRDAAIALRDSGWDFYSTEVVILERLLPPQGGDGK